MTTQNYMVRIEHDGARIPEEIVQECINRHGYNSTVVEIPDSVPQWKHPLQVEISVAEANMVGALGIVAMEALKNPETAIALGCFREGVLSMVILRQCLSDGTFANFSMKMIRHGLLSKTTEGC